MFSYILAVGVLWFFGFHLVALCVLAEGWIASVGVDAGCVPA